MKIADMEFLEPTLAGALAAAGVATTDDLLERAGPAASRSALAKATGIGAMALRRHADLADLMRLPKLTEGFALLLDALDLGSRERLKTAHAPDLLRALRRKNVELTLVRAIHAESQLADWIEQAATEPSRVEH